MIIHSKKHCFMMLQPQLQTSAAEFIIRPTSVHMIMSYSLRMRYSAVSADAHNIAMRHKTDIEAVPWVARVVYTEPPACCFNLNPMWYQTL